ncbi:MAG: hypothetical protein Solumvirus5_8 [Solumvirus sp.]|uniref:Uncharacterized protein n=1 Tax=Solumvirus sp. TaxID=2487773 RepID=A0A3G5AJ50_9VIRU|nr:MAG: hypothetical protein Solumvirus5_8 [Solumvirus sp.]
MSAEQPHHRKIVDTGKKHKDTHVDTKHGTKDTLGSVVVNKDSKYGPVTVDDTKPHNHNFVVKPPVSKNKHHHHHSHKGTKTKDDTPVEDKAKDLTILWQTSTLIKDDFTHIGKEYAEVGKHIKIPSSFPKSDQCDPAYKLEVNITVNLIGGVLSANKEKIKDGVKDEIKDKSPTPSLIDFKILVNNKPIKKGALISSNNGRFQLHYFCNISIRLGKESIVSLGWKPVVESDTLNLLTKTSPETDSGFFHFTVSGLLKK